jgi:hypothetical protein
VTVLISAGTLGALAGIAGPIRFAPKGNLYWDAGPTKLLSVPAGSVSTSANVVNQALISVSDLAVDASNVYLSEPATGNIISVPAIGGGLTTLANAGFPLSSISLHLDGSTLHWLDPNKIVKVPASGGVATQVVRADKKKGKQQETLPLPHQVPESGCYPSDPAIGARVSAFWLLRVHSESHIPIIPFTRT